MLKICTKFTNFLQPKTLIIPYNFPQNFQLHSISSFSTSIDASTTQSFTDFLVNSLGFSNQQASSLSTKVKSFKLSRNSLIVVDFLKKHGFDDTHIRKIVSLYPKVLCSRVDGTLIPKFKLFSDLGMSNYDVIRVVSFNPWVLTHKVSEKLIPNLRAILGSDENLVRFFMKSNRYARLSNLENMFSNVALLENEYGVSLDVIRCSIVQKYGFFMRKPEFFRSVVVRVVEELRITPDSGMFLNGIFLLSSYSDQTIQSKRELFKSFGLSDYHVGELIRRSPIAFLPSEENIKKKLEFFVNVLGYSPDFLASHSALFTYSLEKRMLPRYKVLRILKMKGLLEYKLYTAIIKSEDKFLEQLIDPFRAVVPGLLELYEISKGSSDLDSLSR
ncbi:hypothetical protein vseg_013309 [Gypsophila vaccaria]